MRLVLEFADDSPCLLAEQRLMTRLLVNWPASACDMIRRIPTTRFVGATKARDSLIPRAHCCTVVYLLPQSGFTTLVHSKVPLENLSRSSHPFVRIKK
jgi:hypothetical protein